MKAQYLKSIGVAAFAASILLAGCASSPIGTPSNDPSVEQGLILGAGAIGGAAAGNAINSKYGAPVGAGFGLAAGFLANKALSNKERQAYAEGYAQGARDARVKLLNEHWKEKTTAPRSPNAVQGTPKGGEEETSYNGGTVEGVRYGPRTANQETPSEPTR